MFHFNALQEWNWFYLNGTYIAVLCCPAEDWRRMKGCFHLNYWIVLDASFCSRAAVTLRQAGRDSTGSSFGSKFASILVLSQIFLKDEITKPFSKRVHMLWREEQITSSAGGGNYGRGCNLIEINIFLSIKRWLHTFVKLLPQIIDVFLGMKLWSPKWEDWDGGSHVNAV